MGGALRGQSWTRERGFIVLFRVRMLQWVPSEESRLVKGCAVWHRSVERSGLQVKLQDSSSNRRIRQDMIVWEERVDTGGKRAEDRTRQYGNRGLRAGRGAQEVSPEGHCREEAGSVASAAVDRPG